MTRFGEVIAEYALRVFFTIHRTVFSYQLVKICQLAPLECGEEGFMTFN
jgi:hypothetical protein